MENTKTRLPTRFVTDPRARPPTRCSKCDSLLSLQCDTTIGKQQLLVLLIDNIPQLTVQLLMFDRIHVRHKIKCNSNIYNVTLDNDTSYPYFYGEQNSQLNVTEN